jgi:hypothetical protein
MATWRISEADRNADGKIKSSAFDDVPAEPRSLADLLPKPEAIKQDAARPQRQKLTRAELATLAGVALIACFILIYAWTTPSAPTAPPVARPAAQPTVHATAAATAAPAPTPLALVAYFDYADPETATAIEAPQIERVVGQAGGWRLVQVGAARVWLLAEQLPAGVPADSPLTDLAPRPTARPAVVPASPPAACTQDTAPYVVSRRVLLGTLPIGEATGFSCSSAAEAEAAAAQHEAEVRANYAKTSEAR